MAQASTALAVLGRCDEARPVCSGCKRHLVECVYPSRGGPSQGSARQDAAGISLRVTRAESSSGHSDPGFSPNASSSASAHPGSSEPSARTPGPEQPHSLPVPVEPGRFSPMTTPGYTPYSAASRGLTPPHAGGYPPSSRAPSVASNSSSSRTGSIVREANDYLSHLTDPEILDIPESKERRVWELRLLHNYMVSSAQQALGSRAERPPAGAAPQDNHSSSGDAAAAAAAGGALGHGSFLWGLEIPLLAFENDAILYSMLASSALNMWARSGDPRERDELRLCQQKYLSMALREQRQAVGNLSRDNADTVCMSSLAILQNSFALVQTLPVRPWQPPLEWLRMGKGAGSVLTVARGYLGPPGAGGGGGGGGDKTTRFLSSMPRMDPDEMFTPGNRAHLAWVLDDDRGGGGDHELQDKVTLGVYNRVLSYIGTVQRAIADREPVYAICRRFIGFAVWMPEVYHDFLTQRRPRALVALAHFFKLWIPYDDLWLIGKTGENQVRGIQEALPPQWRHKVDCILEEYHLSAG
ncbi:putative c6 transcription factor [Diaporthe ampelina]|uniref:Putative c6 transcription factor n=1 Tax=Diaporthe ampelina TaxID=1214573 RepID=A0A0G2HPG8_9PEZI|nr:putative c6 transcription factor [Diaporthe ampelina]